jgi:inner membrane protein
MARSPVVRLIVMGLLFLVLLIPLGMMTSVVWERSERRDEAAKAIAGEWGAAQVIGGAVLTIPYRYIWQERDGSRRERVEHAFILPETLTIEGVVEPEFRARGIFDVVVYTTKLKVQGRFPRPDVAWIRPVPTAFDWEAATVDIGVTDPRGIGRSMTLTLAGRQIQMVPGVADNGLFSTGVRAAVHPLPLDTAIPFEFDLELKGTGELNFVPIGDETSVRLQSTWPHPGLTGAPQERQVGEEGFSAAWRVPFFGRGFPSRWTRENSKPDELRTQASSSAFGVALLQPVDIYQQTERAVKYAALFIVLTFVIAFLWEVTGGVLVHPVQYLFVGFAMCIFYLLLLSLAEHVGFDRAYVVAATATVTLLSWYWTWILRGVTRAAVMCVALVTLYGFLYLLLRLEDYALLAGSLGLFAMLALVMFMTRRVDWYNLRLATPSADANSVL